MVHCRTVRLQRWEFFDLRRQIGRSVNQPPLVALRTDGNGGLQLRRNVVITRQATIRTMAIPLWQATAGGTAQHANANLPSFASLHRTGVTRALEKDRHVFHRGFNPTLFLHLLRFRIITPSLVASNVDRGTVLGGAAKNFPGRWDTERRN